MARIYRATDRFECLRALPHGTLSPKRTFEVGETSSDSELAPEQVVELESKGLIELVEVRP